MVFDYWLGQPCKEATAELLQPTGHNLNLAVAYIFVKLSELEFK
jgi:hypothetical protein